MKKIEDTEFKEFRQNFFMPVSLNGIYVNNNYGTFTLKNHIRKRADWLAFKTFLTLRAKPVTGYIQLSL